MGSKKGLFAIAVAAVLAAAGLGACNVVVGTGNPNGCMLFADNPHHATSNPGTLSANVRVTCDTAPAGHHTRLSLYRSPPGAYDWDLVGSDEWYDGTTANINHDLHSQNIPCPGGEFDYRSAASHKYRNGPGWDYVHPTILSRLVTISC